MKTPKIRFKGYSTDWQSSTLKDWLKSSKTRNVDLIYDKNDVLSVSGEFGVVNQIQFHGKSSAGVSVKNYGVVNTGDVVYTKSPLRKQPYGIIKSNKGQSGIVSTLYAIYNCTDKVSAEFVEEYFNDDKRLNDYLRPLVRKGAKNDMKVSSDSALEGFVTFPHKSEQVLIANFLCQISKQINLLNNKIECLSNLKQTMLLQMFPQKGERFPIIRFKQFAKDWTSYSFYELFKKSTIKNDLRYGSDRIISVANMYFIPNTYLTDTEYLKTYNIMKVGDIAFEGNKSKKFSYGRFVENTIGDGIVSHVFQVFSPKKKEHDVYYWKYAINNENVMKGILGRCTKSSTMMTDLVVKDFLAESILVPSYEEQVLIGKFFFKLDNQIALQTQRLEKLKQIKSACLDKMFV